MKRSKPLIGVPADRRIYYGHAFHKIGEKYVRGVDFVGTPLAALSHIIAVGNKIETDNAFCGAESGTIPVSTISPAILMSTLELQAKETSKVTQYALPLPWFGR